MKDEGGLLTMTLKPDLEEAEQRWEAHFAGELVVRPPVWITCPIPGAPSARKPSYHDWIYSDIDTTINGYLAWAETQHWGGESIPFFFPSFGTHEIAAYTGSEIYWNEASSDTNWSDPYVEDWETALPLTIDDNNTYWKRKLAIYNRASDLLDGKMAMAPPDLHTNMGLLATIRGSEALCYDLVDSPEWIDHAMESARKLFAKIWRETTRAGRMDELGYCSSNGIFSRNGAATLECDFSALISPDMFRRWVLPALEEEAALVGHVVYHWDGPGALVHKDALIGGRGIEALSFLPGKGGGTHLDYLGLLEEIQRRGKAIHAGGTPDMIKQMHRRLDPAKVIYYARVKEPSEGQALLEWLAKNT